MTVNSDEDLRAQLLADLGIADGSNWGTPELLLWHRRRVLHKQGLNLNDIDFEALANFTATSAAMQAEIDSLQATVDSLQAQIDGINVSVDTVPLDKKYLTYLSVASFDAVGDGVADDTVPLRNCIAASLSLGGVAYVPPEYILSITGKIDIPAQTRLCIDGRLLRNYVSGSGSGGGMLCSVGMTTATPTKSDNIKIWGTGYIGMADTTKLGPMISMYGDEIHIKDITIDSWDGGCAYFLSGDQMRLYNVRVYGQATSSTGNGGIRYLGGQGFRCFGAWVVSGDDCFQFVPAGNETDTMFDQSIVDGWYIGCTGISTKSKVLVVGTQSGAAAAGVPTMTCSVTDSGFKSCSGLGALPVIIQNLNSTGNISRILVEDCLIDHSIGTVDNALYVSNANASGALGRVEFVTFRRVKVINPIANSVKVIGAFVYDTVIEDCVMSRNAAKDAYVLSLYGMRTKVIGGTFDGAGGTTTAVISFNRNNSDTALLLEPTIKGARIIGIGNGQPGINFANSTRPTLKETRFEEFAGSTTAKAFTAGANCSDLTIIENVWTPGITSTPKFTNSSTGTTIDANNR